MKASREVRVGDLLKVKTEAGEFEVEVLGLSAMRGPAAGCTDALFRNRGEPGIAGEVGRRAQGNAAI